jgi:prepilin-type processing-associated H-X9-DG protein
MKTKLGAFTVLELLIVVCVVFTFVALLFSGTNRSREKAMRINCVCSLKQVGLAYRLWSGDHNDLYPMKFFTNQAGGLLFADATNAFRYFQVMSNELTTPKILVCPSDAKRKAAANFAADFSGVHLSYFVGLNADESHPSLLLSGDRNITLGQTPVNGALEVTTNQNAGWTSELHNQAGNVGMGDGSVQQLNNGGLIKLVENTGLATNRLLFP